jgi:hypothetical protein
MGCVETTELKSPTAGAPIPADGSMLRGNSSVRQQFPNMAGRSRKFLNMAASAGMGRQWTCPSTDYGLLQRPQLVLALLI